MISKSIIITPSVLKENVITSTKEGEALEGMVPFLYNILSILDSKSIIERVLHLSLELKILNVKYFIDTYQYIN
jgi:hypothetical protein